MAQAQPRPMPRGQNFRGVPKQKVKKGTVKRLLRRYGYPPDMEQFMREQRKT